VVESDDRDAIAWLEPVDQFFGGLFDRIHGATAHGAAVVEDEAEIERDGALAVDRRSVIGYGLAGGFWQGENRNRHLPLRIFLVRIDVRIAQGKFESNFHEVAGSKGVRAGHNRLAFRLLAVASSGRGRFPQGQAFVARQVSRSAIVAKSINSSPRSSSCTKERVLMPALIGSEIGPTRRVSCRKTIDKASSSRAS
jgi:hypothetical protein